MPTGTVKWYSARKGYGFIQPDDGGKDVFVHVSRLEDVGLRRLDELSKVSYETYEDRGRVAAGNIRLIEEEA